MTHDSDHQRECTEAPEDNLRRAVAPFGIPVDKYVDEHGIDPVRIMGYKKDNDGNYTFLCNDPDGNKFYLLRATKKTPDWERIAVEFKRD